MPWSVIKRKRPQASGIWQRNTILFVSFRRICDISTISPMLISSSVSSPSELTWFHRSHWIPLDFSHWKIALTVWLWTNFTELNVPQTPWCELNHLCYLYESWFVELCVNHHHCYTLFRVWTPIPNRLECKAHRYDWSVSMSENY